MPKKHSAYVVKWRDSSTLPGWKSINDSQHDVVPVITSVGWVIRTTPKSVTLTTSISEHGNVADAMTIPREAITRMTKLKHYVEGD